MKFLLNMSYKWLYNFQVVCTIGIITSVSGLLCNKAQVED